MEMTFFSNSNGNHFFSNSNGKDVNFAPFLEYFVEFEMRTAPEVRYF